MQQVTQITQNSQMTQPEEIIEVASSLQTINYQIAELQRIKEELDKRISALLEHEDEGQRSYTRGKYKITVSTGYNYSLDKEEYSIIKNHLPECFNPVKEKISFEIDKKIIKEVEALGSSEDRNRLASFLIMKPKKIHVRISAAN